MRLTNQRGFTMIEMMVALLIAGIFFSIFAGVVLATFETLQSGDERTVAQQNARVAVNYITNDIRHTKEIAPLRLEAYRDWADGGLPYDEYTDDPFFADGRDAWPVYRRSVDSHYDSSDDSIINLDIDGGTGDGDEYFYFRKDGDPYDGLGIGRPYDVRAIAPNRISLLFWGSSYYPNTEYWSGSGTSVDLDTEGSRWSNPNVLPTRVTYEHQLVEPYIELYDPAGGFSGREKSFEMMVNATEGDSIKDTIDFVIVRSFEILNPTVAGPDTGESEDVAEGPLGAIDDQIREDEWRLRQPVADHVLNMRFRYWHIGNGRMMEIRYDPNIKEHLQSSEWDETNDGYYRYYNIYGNEIYVMYNWYKGEDIDLLATDCDCDDIDALPVFSFLIHGGDNDNEFERGILLFEGWKFVNAVSITVKTANNRTLDIYRSSIDHNLVDPLLYDYGMGFIDFGLDTQGTSSLNRYEPLYQGADNLRTSRSEVRPAEFVFDFVEPNMNPNYEASAFNTLQTFVAPPALKERAERAVRTLLTHGLSHTSQAGG